MWIYSVTNKPECFVAFSLHCRHVECMFCLCNKLEKKARELMQIQRSVVDLQYRLVEDRNQWQLEVSQLQRQLEETRQTSTQQKESIHQLLAEVRC